MRARREATSLLSPAELRQREAQRQRAERLAEAEGAASGFVERALVEGAVVDARVALTPAVYRAVFALDPAVYLASAHWARVEAEQLELVAACEVARCGERTALHAHRLIERKIGEERPGVDLMTLCDGCRRRAARLAQRSGRPPTREQIRGLDPQSPLYSPAEIAALKAKHAEP